MSNQPQVSPKAYPLANDDLTAAILQLISQAVQNKQLRKGANEVTKTLNRSVAELVIIAGDSDPIEIVMHLPLLCEDKNVPYIFIPSRAALGRACGVSRSVIACSITKKDSSRLKTTIDNLKIKVEEAFVGSE
ncbi:NHP2-like protein 1 [Tritrichomonas foetus]|uniref:H/ACA ribonucleoprotein complex subunit 2 n=1 Tax=Tritrichomonas foetus TaxID=1144522 RepID=A0A1J4JEV5_9EUKA|nr:NHP2-like protein 1 [Tritrichomonas foetus]|eukprot:OHS96831.1 NHP2-like protein 1 [Tritrichomonas foetus]